MSNDSYLCIWKKVFLISFDRLRLSVLCSRIPGWQNSCPKPNLTSSHGVEDNIVPSFRLFVSNLRIHELFLAVPISSDAVSQKKENQFSSYENIRQNYLPFWQRNVGLIEKTRKLQMLMKTSNLFDFRDIFQKRRNVNFVTHVTPENIQFAFKKAKNSRKAGSKKLISCESKIESNFKTSPKKG